MNNNDMYLFSLQMLYFICSRCGKLDEKKNTHNSVAPFQPSMSCRVELFFQQDTF